MNEHEITLIFEDGRTTRIKAKGEETVYAAALRQKTRLQSDCLEGACATCKVFCSQGEYVLRDYSDEALSDEEARDRFVLACRMLARSDCVLEVPYDAAAVLGDAAERRRGRVVSVDRVSSSVVRLDLDPGEGARMSFLPGQYVHLEVPGTGQQRSYSFANAPESPELLRFYIKMLEKGVMSEYIVARAKAGDEMFFAGPFGRFYLRPPTRPVLMVAGGTGLAPMLSMLDQLVATGASKVPVHLLYGSNAADELFALEQLTSYASHGLSLTYECAVAQDESGWPGRRGYVTDLLRPELVHGGDCNVYVCGPPPMIDASMRWLSAQGVGRGQIYSEKFLPS